MWTILTLLTFFIHAGVVSGRAGWHMDEVYFLASEQLDSIVNPNAQSSHMHRIMGGSDFRAAYNFDSARQASCSSVGFQADKSNYWMPQLYWVDSAGTSTQFAPLTPVTRVYYFMSENTANSNVTAFPDGLRILAGNPNAKSVTGANAPYAFSCQRNRNLTDIIQGPDFNFDMDCPYGLKTNMYYQNCWNGKDLWLPGSAHMSYTANGNPRTGPCPWSHPVRLPSMMLEAVWNPSSYAPGTPLKGKLAWANGDTTGYAYHADFTNGWDRDVFIAAMASPACDGVTDNIAMSACPVFAASLDRNKALSCRPDAGTLKEPTGVVDLAPIPALPGCNPLWGATGSKPTCNPAVSKLDVSSLLGTDGSLVAKPEQQRYFQLPTAAGWHNIGCVSTGGLLNSISYQDTGKLTQDRCTESCLEAGFHYAGVGNHADTCYCGTGIDPSVAFQENMCTVKCPGNSSQTCGNEYIVDLLYAPNNTFSNTAGRELSGCYSPSGNNNLKNSAMYSFISSSLTLETCKLACVNRNSTWAMMMAAVNCYCGNTNLDTAVVTGGNYVPMDSCNSACSGNSSQICGGQYVGSLYNLSNTDISAKPAVKPPGWLGCYSGGGNALTDVTWLNNTLTVDSCVNGCSEMGYKYSGVSVGNKCQCGNSNTNFGNRLPYTECTVACKGNATETCGAAYAVEIYDVPTGADYTLAQLAKTYPANWMGCYASTGSNLQLTNYSWTSTSMTVETCKTGCVQFGYNFAGVSTKTTCNCGLAPASRLMPHDNCNNPCGGNAAQFCGASGFMDVYNVTSLNSAGPSTSMSTYLGCFQDAASPRGLTGYTWTSDLMSKDVCRSSCLEVGPYALAGVENGNACYCGDKWSSGKLLPESSCSTACKGNSTQMCGGSSAASLYNTTGAPIAAATKPVGWLGCYTSGSFSAGFYSSASMTSANCRASCAGQGYAYSATRAGNGCYCSQTMPAKSTRNPAVNCNTPCTGNSSETCGAAYLVEAYNATVSAVPTSGYIGCFADPGKINNISYTSTYMTRDTCNQYCMARSFPFAMTTYGNRCWCGVNRPAQLLTDSTCSTTCTGNSSLTCGGSNIGSVFSLANSNISPAISLTTSSTDGYIGCFLEGSTKFGSLAYSLASNTPASCRSTCKGLGFSLSGVETGNECYCANTLGTTTGGYRVADSECSTVCTGDASQKCGGSGRLALRSTDGAASGASTNGQEGNIGCFQTGNAIANAKYDVVYNGMAPGYCRRTCRAKGFSSASLLNGNRCLCGTRSDAGATAPATLCNSACAGNSSLACGGASQISMYDTSGAGALAPVKSQPGYVGCYINDSPSAFAYSTTSSTNTLQYCSRLCASMKYPTFATSGITCACGSQIPGMMQIESACATTCPGAGSTDICGGSSRFSVFTSNTTTITTASFSATTSSTTAAVSSTIKVSSAVTSSASSIASVASSIKVSSAVTSSASSIASVASSKASTAASATASASTKASSAVTSAATTSRVSSTTASGTATRSLPSGNLIVSATGTTATSSAPTASGTSNGTDVSRLGCYATDFTIMSNFKMNCSTLDPSMCKVLCRYKGFAYAAVSSGDTCSCGSSVVGLVESSKCAAPCTGDSTQTCGDVQSMEVYRTREVALPVMNTVRRRKASSLIRKTRKISGSSFGSRH